MFHEKSLIYCGAMMLIEAQGSYNVIMYIPILLQWKYRNILANNNDIFCLWLTDEQ